MPAAIIGGVIAGAGAVGAAAIGKSASNKAADTAAQATNNAADQAAAAQQQQIALQREIYDKNAALLDPFVKMGTNVNDSTYLNAMGLNGGDAAKQAYDAFRGNTGYDWQLGEGLRAIDGNYAGSGTFHSGAREKARMQYGQGLASSSYNDWLGRLGSYNDTLRAFGLSAASAQAGVGQNFAGAMGNSANNLSNIAVSRGDNLANAALVNGRNNANIAGSVAGSLGQIGGSFLQQSYAPSYGSTSSLFNNNLNSLTAANRAFTSSF